MLRWKFKCCPRCGGDFFLDTDMDGWYEQCLQCSYRNELRNLAELKPGPTQGEKTSAGQRKRN